MKTLLHKVIAVMIIIVLFGTSSFAQLTGSKTIPGDYATIALAIADLNAVGVGSGGVVFNIVAGYTETITAPLSITATGTASDQIVFQKNSSGTSPLITAYVGTSTPGSAVQDGIWNLVGSDYVTINGIDLYDPNTTNPATMEYGYGMFKASVTNGCQNNTIINCIVTLSRNNNASGSSPAVDGSRAINIMNSLVTAQTTVVTPTSASGANSFNKVYSNTLQNCNIGIALIGYAGATPFTLCDFGNDIGGTSSTTGNTILNYGGATAAANPAAAVRTLAQYNLNVSYNTVNNNNGSGVNHPSTLRGIYLNTAVSANASINNNILTINGGSTTSQISVIENVSGSTAAGNTININNNTINNCTWSTATSGIFYGILNSSTAFTVNISGNVITNMTTPNTGNWYAIAGQSPANLNIFNNEIGNITKTVSGTLYAIQAATATVSIHDNNVHDLAMNAGGNAIYGIYDLSSPTNESYYNNTFTNFTCLGTGGVFGVYTNTVAGTRSVYSNTISNFSAVGGGPVYGIYGASSSPNIYKNNVFNLSSGTATGIVYGIYLLSGTTANIYNNFVSDLKAPAATGANAVIGINIAGGTTVNAYYNTVYLNAVSTGTTFGSSGINKSATTASDIRNNIIVNNSTPGSVSGNTVALRWSGVYNATYYTATSNNNDLYAGTPAANYLIFFDGTNSDQTIATYKARVAPRDANSISENPPFISIATSPYNLHLATGIPTQCESGAGVVSTPVNITDDYDGNARSSTTPDIGADEGTFTLLDLTPPVFTYTPLPNTSSLSARTITVTITDPSLVGTGANQPVMYWAIGAGAYTGPVAPTAIAGSQYTFTFGAGVALGDVVKYYFVAQDQATTPNVGSSPAGATVTANPPVASAPPAVPNSYTIWGCISGVKTVGLLGDYTTLTAAFAALNSSELCGPMTLSLLDATYPTETFPLVLNSNPGASAVNTLTIKPAAGVTVTVSGSLTSALIKILNKFTTIDGSNSGGTTRDLTLTNISATTPQVLVVGSTGTIPITDVTIKNCIVTNGVNTSSAIITSDGAAPGTAGYFNNITYQNNSISKAYIGVYNNAVVAAGNGSGLLLTGNEFIGAAANSIAGTSIYVQGVDGVTVTNNTIKNGTHGTLSANPVGVWFAIGTKNGTISGNTISDLSYTGTASYSPIGILVSSGLTGANVEISGNTVSGLTSSGTGWTSGINAGGGSAISGINILKNKISNIKNTHTTGYSANGIVLWSSLTSANMLAANNFIWDVAGYGWSSHTTDNGYGIRIEAGGGYSVYYNSVNLATNQISATGYPAALQIGSTVTTANSLDIRNNIFAITSTIGSDRYAIQCNAANTVFSNLNNNDYYTTGTNLGYIAAANVLDLAAWKTATGKDVNSISGDPLYLSATDLHINTAGAPAPVSNAGTPIAAVTTDIDNWGRHPSTPDIGADEFILAPTIVSNPATSITSTTATLNGAVTANFENIAVSFKLDTNPGFGAATTYVATPSSVTGNIATPVSYNITGLIPNTTYYFMAVGTVGPGVYNGVPYQSFTTAAILPTVVTTAATSVASASAVLNGTANANNASTVVTFEYGLTTSYGTTVTAVPSPVTGTTNTAVSYSLSGLVPNTTYHFRVVGVNAAGTAHGGDLTFTTSAIPPTVITNAATLIASTGAVLNGTVNANNASTAVTFEFGLTTSYGSTFTAVPAAVTGVTATGVSYSVSGLTPSTTYHFRAIGVNTAGTVNGLDQVFTTTDLPGPAGPIAGTSTVCQGQNGVVYTVGPIINATGYVWSVPPGAVIASGSNTNSITVNFPTPNSGNITVYGINLAGNGTVSPAFPVAVQSAPTVSITPAGPVNLCAGNSAVLTASSTSYLYPVSGMFSSSQEVPPSGSPATGIFNGTFDGGTNLLTVNINFAGLTAPTTAAHIHSAPPGVNGPVIIPLSGFPAGVNGGIYSGIFLVPPSEITNFISGNTYINIHTTAFPGGEIRCQIPGAPGPWSPDSYSWNTGATTPAITVSAANTYTVTATSINGCSTAASAVVNVNPLPVPVITGPASACLNSTGNVYSTAAGMTGYVWNVPAGGTITAGGTSTSNTATVTWNTAGAQTVTVNYTNGNNCSAVAPTVYNVTVNSLPVPTITGPSYICQSSTGNIYTTEASMTGYTWTLSAGGTITAGAGTNSITVTWNTAGAQFVNVNYTNANSCAASAPTVYAVNVNPTPTVNAVGNQAICNGASTAVVPFSGSIPGTVFNWTNNTPSIGLAANGTGDIASFVASNSGNTPLTATVTVTPVYTAPLNLDFAYTGTIQTWTVPAGVTSINIKGNGAQGGRGGGLGASITGDFAVTPGETLKILVGGQGTTANNANGGGGGGTFIWNNAGNVLYIAAGGGGGRSTNSNPISQGGPGSATNTATSSTNGAGNGAGGINGNGGVGGTVDNPAVAHGSGGGGAGWLSDGLQGTLCAYNATGGVTPLSGGSGGFGWNNCDNINVYGGFGGGGGGAGCSGASGGGGGYNGGGGGNSWKGPNSVAGAGWGSGGGGGSYNIGTAQVNLQGVQPGNGIVTIKYPGLLSCTGTPVTFTITANPTPTVTPVTNLVLCNGAPSGAIAFSGAVAGTVFNWTNNTTSIGLAASGTGNITSFAAVNTGTTPVVATITVTPTYTNAGVTCTGTPVTFTITVNPKPTVNAVANQVLCNGATTTAVTFGGAVTGTVFNWTNNTTSIGLAASGTGTIAGFAAVNTTAAPVVATITVTPSYTNAGVTCLGVPTTFTITVNPTPTVNPVTNLVLCNGAPSGAIAFSSPVTGTVYNWTNNTTSIGLAASGTGTIASFAAVNTGTTPVVATITVTPTFTNAGVTCTGIPVTFTITVNPTPTVNAVANQVLCNGATTTAVTFSGAITGTVFNWTNTAASIGLAASGTGTIAGFAAVNTTAAPVVATITVTPSYTNSGVTCSGVPTTFTITVNPTPSVNAVANQTVCKGANSAAVTFSGAVAGTVFNWTNTNTAIGLASSGTGTIASFVALNTGTTPISGTITVTPSFTNAGVTCTGVPVSFTITVNPGSVPTLTGAVSVCEGSTGVIYTTEAGAPNYVWTISYDGVITAGLNSNQVTVTWPTAGARTIGVNYPNVYGCSALSPTVKNVTVLTTPVPMIFGPNTLCQGTAGAVYTTQPGNTAYAWTVSAGGTITAGAGTDAITVTWNIGGNQTVSVNYTNAGGCRAAQPTAYSVAVTPLPAAGGTITGPASVCSGTQGAVYTIPAIANATTYNWTVPAGATIASGAATNSITVNFAPTAVSGIIKVNGVNTCGSGSSSPNFTVTVNPVPATPVITKVGDTLISSAPAGNQWYLNGVAIAGATARKFRPVYLGTYTVVVTLNGCSSLVSNAIIVTAITSLSDPDLSRSFEVYPNPNLGQFNIKVVSAKPVELNIEIYNSVGALQWKQEKVTVDGTYTNFIDLGKVPAGVYMVALRNKDINLVRRVVIMK